MRINTSRYSIAETIMKCEQFKGLSNVHNVKKILRKCVSSYDRYGYCKLIWDNINKNEKVVTSCLSTATLIDPDFSPLVCLVKNETCTTKWLKLVLFNFGKMNKDLVIDEKSLKRAFDICLESDDEEKHGWCKLIVKYATETNQTLEL